jgi:hypothetical protein
MTNKLGERAPLILTLIVSLLSILSVGLSACPPACPLARLHGQTKPTNQLQKYRAGPWGLYYKTFYGRIEISYSVCR